MADRTYNVEDRIRELGEDPATAYANAKAAGMAGDAPPPSPIGPGAPELAPSELGVAPPPAEPIAGAAKRPAPPMPKPEDLPPPASAEAKDQGPEPLPAPGPKQADTGTFADTQQELPNFDPGGVISNPAEPPASFNELFTASRHIATRDNGDFDERMLHTGYAPIVRALGLPISENPAAFSGVDDAQTDAKTGYMGSPSLLATQMGAGQEMPWGGQHMANRADQERLIAQAIQQHRLTDKNFLPGVPDTVDGLHAYFRKQQAAAQKADEAVLARSPGGLAGMAAQFGGGTVGQFEDPLNVAALALPVGEGKSLLQIAARDALLNGVLEAAQQPTAAHNRAELGESYGVTDALENVAEAAAGGAVLGPALHLGGKAVAATGIPQALGEAAADAYSGTADRIFHALPDRLQQKWGQGIVKSWAQRLANGEKLDDVFSDLSNRELTTLSRTIVGDENFTPAELDARNVLERSADVAESSPYQPGPKADAAYEGGLADAMKSLSDRMKPQETDLPSGSSSSGLSGAASPAAAPERPPAALSTAERPHGAPTPVPAPYSRDEAIARFKQKVGGAEDASGDPNAKNPRSSASGVGQFTDDTFRRYYHKLYGVDLGPKPDPKIKNDPAIQRRLLDSLTEDNAAELEKAGEPVSVGNLYLAHFLGARDALRVLRADASTPIEKLLSERVLDANPFLRGKSTSQVAGWAHTKMGEYKPYFVEPRGAAGALDPAIGGESEAAQLNEEALQLDNAVLGLTTKPDGTQVNLYAKRIPVSELNVDPERFQFKEGGDQYGVTDKLRGVTEVDPMQLDRLTVWQDRDGRYWVADGHQRTGLLKREAATTGVDRPVDVGIVREADGVTPEEAMVMAAIKNIADDKGTKIDAAKIGRHNADALEAAAARMPQGSAVVRDGRAIARLSEPAFRAVTSGRIAPDYAAVIGHLLPDRPEAHEAMIDLLAKLDPANRGQAESIVRQAMAAGLHTEEQVDLFGTHSHVTTLMLERAKVLEKVLRKLREFKQVFKTAAEKAGTLEAVGSKIAKAASEKEAQANAQALELVTRLAFSKGPIADILNDAAAKLKAGAELSTVAGDAAAAIREIEPSALAGNAAGDDSSRLAVEGAGRGGDVGEEGPQPPSQSGDQEQPSRVELEEATKRFSDPDGPAVKQQADSLFHDLAAELTNEEADRRAFIDGAKLGYEGKPFSGFRAAAFEGYEHGLRARGAGPEESLRYQKGQEVKIRVDGKVRSAHILSYENGEPMIVWKEGGELGMTRGAALNKPALDYHGLAEEPAAAPPMREPAGEPVAALSRRELIKAATADLEGAKPGELRTVQTFLDEPGYHRFRYVSKDGEAIGGSYNVAGDTIEGLSIGDKSNPAELGPKELLNMFEQLFRQHPEAKYVQAYRTSGARIKEGAGEEELWFERGANGKGVKRLDGAPSEAVLHGGTSGELGRFDGSELQKLADEADKALQGKAADAIDRFIGHGPMSRDKEGPEAVGIMSARDLERAIAEGGETAAEIEKAFAPVRAAIEAKTGPTVKLYRVQQPVEWDPKVHYGSRGDERQRAVLSWTSDPKFADFHAGADPRLDRPDISEEKIAELEKKFEETGEVKVSKSVTLKREPEGYIGIYDERSGGFVTDTDSVRAYLEGENRSRAEYRDSNAAKRSAIVSADVPLKDVVWVSDRAGQSEFIVRNEPGSAHFIDEHGKLTPGEKPTLDLGEQTDPAAAAKNRQLTQLAADAPLRPEGIDRVAAEDMAGSFRLTEEGDEISAADLLADLEADDKALKAMKDCL